MKILVVLLYLLCLILCKKVKGSANVEEALSSGDGDYSLDDDTEEGEDEQYDYSQNKTETSDNDEYDDAYYEMVEQTETNRFYFPPLAPTLLPKNIFILNYFSSSSRSSRRQKASPWHASTMPGPQDW